MARRDRKLPAERAFRDVLTGCVLIIAVFALGFIIAIIDRAHTSPASLNAAWFGTWGTWAGGLATAAAFLIAAASIAVTGAHARADRHDAAMIRESEDMAQARLLIVYQVDMPTQPQSFRFYRIDNRSKDMFFDVTVPFAERYSNSSAEPDLLTPDAFTGGGTVTMEYLPQGELLAPYRSRSQDDIWFTEVRVYAAPQMPVNFTVYYTDAGGRAWKQHLDGTIERVPTSEAVQRLPREADTVQPYSQIRVLTEEEKRDPTSLFSDVPPGFLDDDETDDDSLAELEAIAPVLVNSWKPVARIGTPRLTTPKGARDIRAEIAYAPTAAPPWRNYFVAKLRELGLAANQFRSQGNVAAIILEIREDDLDRAVEQIDVALDHANQLFEANEVEAARAVVARISAREAEQAEVTRRLDELAAKHTRPGQAPWDRRRPAPPQRTDPESEPPAPSADI